MVWRRPEEPISEAVARAEFVPGDRIICLEWCSEDPPPALKWHKDLRSDLSKEESDFLDIEVNRIRDAGPDREQLAEGARRGPDPDVLGYSDEDLLYILFGVPDGRMIRKF